MTVTVPPKLKRRVSRRVVVRFRNSVGSAAAAFFSCENETGGGINSASKSRAKKSLATAAYSIKSMKKGRCEMQRPHSWLATAIAKSYLRKNVIWPVKLVTETDERPSPTSPTILRPSCVFILLFQKSFNAILRV